MLNSKLLQANLKDNQEDRFLNDVNHSLKLNSSNPKSHEARVVEKVTSGYFLTFIFHIFSYFHAFD